MFPYKGLNLIEWLILYSLVKRRGKATIANLREDMNQFYEENPSMEKLHKIPSYDTVYKSIKRLEQKGFIYTILGKPLILKMYPDIFDDMNVMIGMLFRVWTTIDTRKPPDGVVTDYEEEEDVDLP